MCDLAETLRCRRKELDWPTLTRRAGQWGAQRCLYLNLRLVRELLNAPVPEEGFDPAVMHGFDASWLELAKECLFECSEGPAKGLPGAGNLVEVFNEKSLPGKLVRTWKSFFVSRRAMAMRYPVAPGSWKVFLYYPVRLKDILIPHGKTILGLLSGEKRTSLKAQHQLRVNAIRKWMLSE